MPMKNKTWARHSNPLSGWSRVVGFFVMMYAIYIHNWWLLGGVVVFIAVNPLIFPKPKKQTQWMSRAVLGEQIYTKGKVLRWDFPTLLNLGNGIFFILGVWGAWYQYWEIAVFGTILSSVFKLWFLDRMVFLYDESNKKPGA